MIPRLTQAGHSSIALDLPGHGHDRTPPDRIFLDGCVRDLLACIDAQPEPVVLVAHSRNGIVISQAAERRPDRVLGLVYLAAYLVPHGRSMMDYALSDTASLVVQNTRTSIARRHLPLLVRVLRRAWVQRLSALLLPRRLQVHRLARSAYREALYHDCGEDITELANVLLEAEPNWPGFTPLRLTAERYGRVPKVYIECLLDRAVTLPLQRRMQADTRCDHVYALDAGHSPFFSQPEALVRVLIDSLRIFAPAELKEAA